MYFEDKKQKYLQCLNCFLIFVPPKYHLNTKEERARYDLHQNNPNDSRYKKFLNKIFLPIHHQIGQNSHGLDFGCGPGPTLSLMFTEFGHSMDIYDKFYAKDEKIFSKKYDFITATEVLEHLSDPMFELQRLCSMLKPNGILGIMTKIRGIDTEFRNWYYKDDPTHICFYSTDTFRFIAGIFGLSVEFIGDDVILMCKGGLKIES